MTQTTATIDYTAPIVQKVLWAAMCSMVLDVHAPQDNLTDAEWNAAKAAFETLDAEMNRGR